MSKTTKNWMDKLVENYRIPTEEEIQRDVTIIVPQLDIEGGTD